MKKTKKKAEYIKCIYCDGQALTHYKHYPHLCKCVECSRVFDDRKNRQVIVKL